MLPGDRAAKLNVKKILLVHFLYQAKVRIQVKYYDKAYYQADKDFFRVHTKLIIVNFSKCYCYYITLCYGDKNALSRGKSIKSSIININVKGKSDRATLKTISQRKMPVIMSVRRWMANILRDYLLVGRSVQG